jgi:hypothetical protein
MTAKTSLPKHSVKSERFLAKGGDRGMKAGSVYAAPVDVGSPGSQYLQKGGRLNTVGSRMSGLSSSAKVSNA